MANNLPKITLVTIWAFTILILSVGAEPRPGPEADAAADPQDPNYIGNYGEYADYGEEDFYGGFRKHRFFSTLSSLLNNFF